MKHYFRTVAQREFADEPDVKVSEELAEQLLVRNYLQTDAAGFFVEVGANDPFHMSQTWHLAKEGWRGVLVEPIPSLCRTLRQERKESHIVEAACTAPDSPPTATFTVASDSGKSTLSPSFLDGKEHVESQMTVNLQTLDDILCEIDPPTIDFVTIDVEGTQLDVLRGFDLHKWKPRLLLVEDHLLDTKSHKHIVKQQYQLVKRTLFNNWYIPNDAPRPETGSKEQR